MDQSQVKLSVVIPAYNEEFRLPKTLSQSLRYLEAQPYRSEVIVVNDGSSDKTESVVRGQSLNSVPLRLLNHPDGVNHGKGASVRRGMMEARGAYRLFMDADNSTTLNQVDRFWPMFSQGYDVVIGSRALKDSIIGIRQNKLKEIAGKFGNWVIQRFAVPGVLDTQAGFKMLTAEKAEIIFPCLTIDRWGYDVEMLVVARTHGCRIAEIPITWINATGSKVTMGTYFQVLGEIWKIRRNFKAGLYK
ncbi:MAG: dolichyl-phosphate beta-glucosyltransferase [Acidobacteriota bacterium]